MTEARGHRARLWKRFMEKDGLRGAFVHPYEKLEFLLTFVMPRVDTKPVAKALLARFGSLSGVAQADAALLEEVDGVGPKTARFLTMLHELGLVFDEEVLARRRLLHHPDLLRMYLRKELAHEEAEYLMVIYVDSKQKLIHMERLFRGTIDRVAQYPRELAKEALRRNAAGVILAHNHPSGEPQPSIEDVRKTVELAQALALVGVALHDHLVVGAERVVSMHEEGLLG